MLGPLLVASFVLLADAGAALVGAAVVTFVGHHRVALGQVCGAGSRTPTSTAPAGLAPCGSRVTGPAGLASRVSA